MADKFAQSARSVLSPSEQTFAVVPHDTDPILAVSKYLYIGTAGNVTLRTKDADSDVVFENVPAGGYIYARVSHVRATGTTAASIIGCA